MALGDCRTLHVYDTDGQFAVLWHFKHNCCAVDEVTTLR